MARLYLLTLIGERAEEEVNFYFTLTGNANCILDYDGDKTEFLLAKPKECSRSKKVIVREFREAQPTKELYAPGTIVLKKGSDQAIMLHPGEECWFYRVIDSLQLKPRDYKEVLRAYGQARLDRARAIRQVLAAGEQNRNGADAELLPVKKVPPLIDLVLEHLKK